MTKQQLREAIRAIIKKELTEALPAISPPKPTIKPTTPITKPGKPRRLGNPNIKPKPKATMTEADMVDKIIKRFRKNKTNEGFQGDTPTGDGFSGFRGGKTWSEGYEEGYNEGYKDATNGNPNKFKK